MAERAPGWLTSDQLTLLGLTAQIAAGAGYAFSRYNRYALLLVILFLVLNWFGDSMDGTLARVRRQPRPRYGFYVDHVVDIFGSAALLCGLGLSGFLHWQTALAMLVAFLLLSGESYLATYTLSSLKCRRACSVPRNSGCCSLRATSRCCAIPMPRSLATGCCCSMWVERSGRRAC